MTRRGHETEGFALDPALRSQAPLRAGARRAFTLIEGLVALSVMAVVLVAAFITFHFGRKDRATWETKVDDVYMVLGGMERMRREIEVARAVAAPELPAANASSAVIAAAQREFLITVDAAGQVVVYSVKAGALIAETFGPRPVEPRILIPRIDRIVFSFRPDNESVRFQLFLGGLTLICTAQPANDLGPASLQFGDTYGL